MSFSGEVRKEICSCINDKDKKFFCLYGMILFGRKLEPDRINFRTESRTSADTFGKLFKSVFGVKPECTEGIGKKGNPLYSFEIDRDTAHSVFARYRLSAGERSINYDMIATGSLGIFTAGVFLACGSVNDPEKEYHLEFTVPDERLASELCLLLEDIGVTVKTALRRGQHIVYIKGSESIEDTLTFIGATQCTLDLMNVKILKDVRNKINRITNCSNANIEKASTTGLRQVADIELIESVRGIDSLPKDLQEIAELRLDNPEAKLGEIGEKLAVPIGRSGVNRRFSRIKAIADEIRKGGV